MPEELDVVNRFTESKAKKIDITQMKNEIIKIW